MDLKNCKIGVLLEDYLLRRITDLLMRTGAIVHCARDEEGMEELIEPMDFDIAVVGAPKQDGCWLN